MATRTGQWEHAYLQQALHALACVEHRGACASDDQTGDGSGVMTDIPFAMLGYPEGDVAVGTVFLIGDEGKRKRAMEVLHESFDFFGLSIIEWKEVPTNPDVLGPVARSSMPQIWHLIVARPSAVRTPAAFNQLLHLAKQTNRSRMQLAECGGVLYFASLSTTTIVYKALTQGKDLVRFYPQLSDPNFKTRFALFHRRFSTNTRTSWDKAQPFRLIAHNGEINTIAGNRSWSYSREQAMGLPPDQLLTRANISDSGSLNEMVEALKYRSGMPHTEDILAIMMPPATHSTAYYEFWGRAMEPWDGPAFVTYGDGKSVGARLDRNGFRPCRWAMTADAFYLGSEAGSFDLPQDQVTAKGTLQAGQGMKLELKTGEVHFRDPSESRENSGAVFEPRLVPLPAGAPPPKPLILDRAKLFGLNEEEVSTILEPMVAHGKEPIGSMGDTARMAVFSDEWRSFYDYFFQRFAQVTNPPLDYLRERTVTDLATYLGRRPNIFAPKEMLPPQPGAKLRSPVLTLEEMATVRSLNEKIPGRLRLRSFELDCTFAGADGGDGLRMALSRLGGTALEAAKDGAELLILTDRHANAARPPVPSLLALRSVVRSLNKWGLRLECSLVLEAGDVRSTHELACAVGFGATAVCPHLAMELARFGKPPKDAKHLTPDEREANLRQALQTGLLKVMSKMGISVVRSYQSSKLFAAVGLSKEIIEPYFQGLHSPIGGMGLDELAFELGHRVRAAVASPATKNPAAFLPSTYQHKEQSKGKEGEQHSMTAARSRVVHKLVRHDGGESYEHYLELGRAAEPVSPRHLFDLGADGSVISLGEVEPEEDIMRRFGTGAMSFGAISAESQRDLFVAMRRIGGRCNSGEGGENPYYFVDGTTATTKQVASGRFGVNAEYLVTGDEVEIKIAQGAKPGEGGQLMGSKVDENIARARHATPGVSLISPPPLHDLYSIEDLKALIYELKQLEPSLRVCVKLVAGPGIGTVAVGASKAGADVIQISGGDGGTGAAPVSSMKHAGLPWELGLAEVHSLLVEHGLRHRVQLRVDGGMSSGKDIVIAAIMGAEEFGFGKLALVAQGCIMARICQGNRCPTGIATHDPKFKAKYKGTPEHVVEWMTLLARDVRGHLAELGVQNVGELAGRADLLRISDRHQDLVRERNIDLSSLLAAARPVSETFVPSVKATLNALNQEVLEATRAGWERGEYVQARFDIGSTDRAVLASLAGALGHRSRRFRAEARKPGNTEPDFDPYTLADDTIDLTFTGSAGQGFGAFLMPGVHVRLQGEANDSVCKSMSGGHVDIVPHPRVVYEPETNVIIGNTALYGATGGRLFVRGLAGDRFAVRNSGAIAVVEGVGLHACEYMTGGEVVILGDAGPNVGAGMTGGALFLRASLAEMVNDEYLASAPVEGDTEKRFRSLLEAYVAATGSATGQQLLAEWSRAKALYRVFRPKGEFLAESRSLKAG